MVVARNPRCRRSPAPSSSSPTSLMLPPSGASDPFCSSPIVVSDVTDLPDPLSPTRHRVSPSRTCSETPSIIRASCGFLPRPTVRLSISRTMLVMSALSTVTARSQRVRPFGRPMTGSATKQSIFLCRKYGLLRFARNDGVLVRNARITNSFAALALLQTGIERVAGGVADQVDAQDRDRQHETRPEDQRRLG